MIVNCISSPVWYHYLYGALLFVSTRRIWPLEVSHLTKVNLIHLLSLLKNQQRSVMIIITSWRGEGGRGDGTYPLVVGQVLSLESEPSSLPATNVVRVFLLQIPNFVITLQSMQESRNMVHELLCTVYVESSMLIIS